MRGSEGGKAWGKTQKRIALQKYYNNPNICKKCPAPASRMNIFDY